MVPKYSVSLVAPSINIHNMKFEFFVHEFLLFISTISHPPQWNINEKDYEHVVLVVNIKYLGKITFLRSLFTFASNMVTREHFTFFGWQTFSTSHGNIIFETNELRKYLLVD